MRCRAERDVWLIVLFSLPVSMSVSLRMVFFMPYLSMLGLTRVQMGLVATAGTAAMALLAFPMGLLADLRGRKPLLASSRLVIAISDLMFYFFRDFASLLLANLLGGIGTAMAFASRQALLADKARGPLRRRAFTVSFVVFSVGSVIGSFLAGFPDFYAAFSGVSLLEATRLLFLFCFALSLTAVLLVLPVREERSQSPRGRSLLTIRSWRVVGSYCAFQVLLGSGAGLVIPWFSYYFYVRFGTRLTEIGFLFAITQALLALGSLSAYGLASRIGDVRTAVLCQLASVGALLAIPASPAFTIAAVFYVMRAVLMNMASPVVRAFYMGLLRREERGSASALQHMSFWASRSLGTYGSGFLMEFYSLEAPFFFCAALYVAASALLYATLGRLPPRGRSEPHDLQ